VSNTNNVRLGVCKVLFGGVDLGYTQGGVDVEVKTETHQVLVDQYGKSVINEIILGRTVSVKVPLAETTLDNLVRIMPGAVIDENGAVKASGTITWTTVATVGDTISVNGKTYTAVATGPLAANQFLIGASVTAQAANFVAQFNIDEDPLVGMVTGTSALGVATIVADSYDTAYFSSNTITLAKTGTGTVTLSGATLTGGVLGTKIKVTVPTAVGTSLLAIAQLLTLHPQANADTNRSEDFNIPYAATAGGLKFAYQLEKERIYDVTFTGYPDPVYGNLFLIGDASAI
jgi:hypothetical protein